MRQDDRAGLRLTVIIHLVAAIILLSVGIGREIQTENSFVLDFTKEEELKKRLEEELRQEKMREAVSDKVDRMLQDARTPVHNIAVNRSLKDDRHSSADAKKLYDDAARLAAELKAGYKAEDNDPDAVEDPSKTGQPEQKKSDTRYSGPSVLSWTLEGRRAVSLTIPAYRCYGAGEVSVAISVDRDGHVCAAKVADALSSRDECLREFALKAAKASRFSRSSTAPERQTGEIVYSFVAQ